MSKRRSPTIRRRRLAAELRRMREAAGYTVEEARKALDWSSGRLNHMEGGRLSRPDASALRDLMNLYNVTSPERRDAILALGRQSKERGWWDTYSDVLTDSYVAFEAEASAISNYQPIAIPGLLQIPEYAAAIARAGLARTDAEIERVVESRRKRQEILEGDDPPEFRVVIDENAIMRLLPNPELAHAQLTHLIKVADGLNSVTIQVLPFSVGLHASTHGCMVILDYPDPLDPSIVYLETRSEGLYLEEPAQVAGYRQAFEHLSMDALSKSGSIEFLKRALPDR
ncbi:helix-turn-helix domain-containing protein [Marinitenerispora sediminis]|uniref:Transcriptional regulator n=1 Tax=Marinitenerispora sediminis TaxID=1931232 RepID=A0A368T4U2_9ACTN|nr:helix-turn-helix transcriptional regulator [Marinitenerispora sediminis]RCV57272.1 transcriptional regulator [Marinitenerispora sediminis]RCV58285.1 transcriptional regulator [Marinitenerispora sediminis]RCV58488.1 transcriptional regulator [Marinitenerispora sediminis]